MNSLDAGCVFSEPQFEKLVSTVTENTNAEQAFSTPLARQSPMDRGFISRSSAYGFGLEAVPFGQRVTLFDRKPA